VQPVVRQLQQLNYNNGNGGVFYVFRAAAVAMQSIGKQIPAVKNTNTTIELLLETVFSIRSMQRGYKEDNWGGLVESQPVKRILGDWCEMAASLGVVS
jgi:hypothetical protein